MESVSVMVFPGAHNLPLWMMEDLHLITATSRDNQIAAVQSGEALIAYTAPDNLRLADAQGLKPFVPATVGPLDLVESAPASPIRLGVDNPDSGFAPLAYAWLGEHRPQHPYTAIPIGGTRERFQALREGRITATVLHPPFTQWGQALGYLVRGRVDDGSQPTLVGVCKAAELANPMVLHHRDAYDAALQRLLAPRAVELATRLFQAHLDLDAAIAHTVAEVMCAELKRWAGSIGQPS